MPHFYFDHIDGHDVFPDDHGLEFDTADQARLAAQRALGEAARDALPQNGDRQISIQLLDESRTPLFRLALTFSVTSISN